MNGSGLSENTLVERITALGDALRGRGEHLVTAESCTGGLIAGACTSIAGSSDWLERGFVTYSNAAKTQMLGVPDELIAQHGAVSQAVAEAMARGALAHSPAQWSVAVTGIAGPGGAVPGKPVGTVWLAWGRTGHIVSRRLQLDGDRDAVRLQTVGMALRVLHEALSGDLAGAEAASAEPSDEVIHALLLGDFEAEEYREWLQALQGAAPHNTVWLTEAEAAVAPERVQVAVVAQPPAGSLARFTQLQLIQSLWAGVDKVLADPTLPLQVPLARMVDPMMTRAMVETAVWSVLSLHRGFFGYAQAQAQAQWQPHAQQRASDWPVLVLGQGEMGSAVTSALQALGYPVTGWRRSSGRRARDESLAQARTLINLLPLTPETRGLLDARLFERLPTGASIVNLARGAHLVEQDLLDALDSGHVAHAVLDVFHTEPLPAAHPFWRHPRVTVLPHAAAMTDTGSAAAVVAENLSRLRASKPFLHVVDRSRGY